MLDLHSLVEMGISSGQACHLGSLLQQIGLYPLLQKNKLFSLVSNLFLYDLLKLFILSTIKPLRYFYIFFGGMSQLNLWGENNPFLPSVREVSQSN